MKMDLSHFKKIHEDGHKAVLQHPKGHQITVAKGALSKGLQKQLGELPMHLAEGGEVDPAQTLDRSPASDAAPMGPPEPIDPVLQQKRALYNQYVNQDFGPNPVTNNPQSSFGPNGEPPAAFSADAWKAAESQFTNMSERKALAEQAQKAKALEDAQARQSAGLPVPAGIIPDQVVASQAAAIPGDGMAQAQQAPQPAQDPFSDYTSMMKTSMGLGMAGIQGQAQAQQLQAQGQVKAAEDYQQQAQARVQHTEELLAENQKEIGNVIQDYKAGHIDPNHLWENKSTLGKVSTAIGLILGGIGGGLLHQENPALKFLNAQIDRDVDAQKANLNNKNNLLAAYMRQYGNITESENALRATYAGMYAAQTAEATAKAGTPLAKAQGQILQSELMQKFMEATRQMTLYRVMSQQSGQGGDPIASRLGALRILNPEMAKDLEKRWLPGVGEAQVPISEEARAQMTARRDLADSMSKLEQFASKNGGSLNPETVKYGTALAKGVQDKYRQANRQGVFKESEKDFVESMIAPDPTAFFGRFRTMPGYKAARDANQSTLHGMYRSYGIQLPQIQEGPPRL